MLGFHPDKKRAAPAQKTAPRLGLRPRSNAAAVAQAQNQAPDSIPGMFKPGEFVLPPDTVHAMGGADALKAVVDATHTPVPEQAVVPAGFKPQVFFANGERPEDQISPSNIYPQGHPSAGANVYGGARQAITDRIGSSGQFAQVPPSIGQQPGRQVPAAAPTPAAVAQGMTDAQRAAALGQIPTGGVAAPPVARAAAPAVSQTPAPAAPRPMDAQAVSDRANIGAAWDTLKDVSDDAGRAIADVAMLVPRGLAGAYDSAVVRPMRAAGLPAGYLSPGLVPAGVDPSSMTPYTDQKRMQQPPAAAAAAAPAPQPSPAVAGTTLAPAAAPAASAAPSATATATADSARPASYEYGPPDAAAPSQVLPGVYRRGNSYADSAQDAALGDQPRGLPSKGAMAAADNLAAQQQSESLARVQAGMAPPPTSALQRVSIVGSGDSLGFRRAAHLRGGDRADAARLREAQRYEQKLGHQAAQQQIERDRIAVGAAQAARGLNFDQQRLAHDRQRLDNDRRVTDSDLQARGLKMRAASQEEALRNVIVDPKATDEQRLQARQALRALSGEAEPSPWAIHITPAVKNADGSTTEGSVYRSNKATGEVQRVDGAKAMSGSYEKGAIYVDAQGNRSKWNGSGWEKV